MIIIFINYIVKPDYVDYNFRSQIFIILAFHKEIGFQFGVFNLKKNPIPVLSLFAVEDQ